jgi:hypothetical protein
MHRLCGTIKAWTGATDVRLRTLDPTLYTAA